LNCSCISVYSTYTHLWLSGAAATAPLADGDNEDGDDTSWLSGAAATAPLADGDNEDGDDDADISKAKAKVFGFEPEQPKVCITIELPKS
jgi:hypothetical protein